jgi:hypothetical protein
MKSEIILLQRLNKEMTFWIGTSKEDNDNMIDKASNNDIWFHANNISSCHVLCRIPIAIYKKEMKYIIKMGALLCKKHTTKLKGISNLEIIYCQVKNITPFHILNATFRWASLNVFWQTVTLQLINHLLYPINRQRRFQGYIIGDLKVQRYKKTNIVGCVSVHNGKIITI